MPVISPDSGYLTVINLFTTDVPGNQDRLLGEMRKIVDTAAYPGWISSTMHGGQDKLGTANFIQWRSWEDLEERYAGEVAFTQRHPSQGDVTEISPGRDDYTVIEVFGVAEKDQDDLVATLGKSQDWLLETPGYRSHSVLRGLRARYLEGSFVVCYSQWDGKEQYDAFRALPGDEQPGYRQQTQARLDSLATWSDWNSYRVVHSRSAPQ